MLKEHVTYQYQKLFSQSPELLVIAPGRINLIGEHTDYNEGFVLPAAVDRSIFFALGLSGHPTRGTLYASDFSSKHQFDLDEIKPLPTGNWQNYLLGVVAELKKTGRKLKGFNMVFSGNIPAGAGMSSSAALECGTCFGLSELFQLNIPKIEMVKLCQQAEHNYAGVKCGIMDQFASMMGKRDKALLLDCKTLEYQYFDVQLGEYTLLLCNSNVSHSLASSAYNERRNQCDEGVSVLSQSFPAIKSLREASIEQLEQVRERMSEVVYRRCSYILKENHRVHQFTKAMMNHDYMEAGDVLNQAQQGMKTEYEITCKEIDFMTEFANSFEGVLGSRMMGGGFGGCTLNLLKKDRVSMFTEKLDNAYHNRFGRSISPIQVTITDGVSLLS